MLEHKAHSVVPRIALLRGGRRRQRHVIDLVCCVLLAILSALAQRKSHAYESDFSLDPDEPAHAVSSLMVHDYLIYRPFANPVSYARNFYDHYPKVAIGHWPPLFYVCEGLWTLIFGRSRAVLLSFVAACGVLLVCSVYLQLRSRVSLPLALFAAILLLFSTSFEQMLCAVRPDLMLALAVFWAAIFAGKYISSDSNRDLVMFIALTLTACLIHGRAALLILMPFVLLLFAGRRVTWRWFIAGIVVVPLFLLPPYFRQGYPLTGSTMLAEIGDFTSYTWTPLHCLALVCLLCGLTLVWRDRKAQTFWASMSALLVSGCLFLLLVPVGWENHYLITVLAAAACLVAGGIHSFQQSVGRAGTGYLRWSNGLVLVCLCLVGVRGWAHVSVKADTGAHALAASGLFCGQAVALVAGHAREEGALIAEAVLGDPALDRTVLRASKSLAIMNWGGDGYRERYAADDQVAAFLNQRRVSLVVIRSAAEERPDIERLRSVVTNSLDWKRSLAGTVEIYRRTN